MRAVVVMVVLVFASVPAFAQDLAACMGAGVSSIDAPATVNAPVGAIAPVQVGLRNGTILGTVTGAIQANWTAEQIKEIQTFRGNTMEQAVLIWTLSGGTKCFQLLAQGSGAPSATVTQPQVLNTPAAANDPRSFEEDQCAQAGSQWLQRIGNDYPTRRRDRTTVLVFKEDIGVCWQSNDRPAQGDPIYIGVFTDNPTQWDMIRADFQPCSLEPDTPSILITDRLPQFPPGRQSGAWVLREYPVRRCWNSSVVVTVRGAESQFSHTLVQASRYRATLHLGVVFTENHETEFGLRPEGGVNKIFAKGPEDKGPEYVAALVFYSLLRYLPALAGGEAYQGRDVIRDNAFADKIGAVVGVGLRNPLKRFIFGASVEIAAGVNILTVWDWAEASELSGVSEGDVFTGTEEQIPTLQEWRSKFVVGVSLDLVYATAAFRR
jgi:hypothetical protein